MPHSQWLYLSPGIWQVSVGDWGWLGAAASVWMRRALHRGCSASVTGFGDLHGLGVEAGINFWDWISIQEWWLLSCTHTLSVSAHQRTGDGAGMERPGFGTSWKNVPGMCGSAGALSQGSFPLSACCLLHSPKLKVLSSSQIQTWVILPEAFCKSCLFFFFFNFILDMFLYLHNTDRIICQRSMLFMFAKIFGGWQMSLMYCAVVLTWH